MDIDTHWKDIKRIFNQSFTSSFHYSIASVDPQGFPHVTPIGSLMLGEPGKAIYFEEFTAQLPVNLDHNPQVCVLAVNSNRWFWLKSLFKGQFKQYPSIRLIGKAGVKRAATSSEIARWHRRIRVTRSTKGFNLLWKNMSQVRELEFNQVKPINIGAMTQHLKQS